MGNTKTIRLLAGLLGVQVLLALGLAFTRPTLSTAADNAALLPLKDVQVDRLTVDGPDTNHVTVAKVNGTWVVPALGNFPADSAKVRRLIDRLKDLKRGVPAATTASARERFKVSEQSFERRVTLGAGGKTVAQLILGTSPNMRQVYARVGDKPAIYSIDFATYEAQGRPEDWQDNEILKLPKAEIEAIDVAGVHLERGGGAAKADSAKGAKALAGNAEWQATNPPKGKQLKAGAGDKLAGMVADLQPGVVLGRDEKPEYNLAKPALDLSVTRKGGKQVEYRIGTAGDKSTYTLKVSSRPEYFRLPSYTADALIKAAEPDSLFTK